MGNVETMRTPSSRRETGSENRPNAIGCMSGIFHLLSRHHNRSRKRLTFAKRKEKPGVAPPTRLTPTPPPPPTVEDDGWKKAEPRRRSCETPRSPTIPQEIRLLRKASPVAAASPDSPRRQPALVARLMGLDDPPAPAAAETVDKRRELLRALEKCDKDLKALRRIIEAVRSTEVKAKVVPSAAITPAVRIESDGWDAKSECNGCEQPSPVSVLDAITSPRYRSKGSPNEKQGTASVGSRIVKPSRMGVLFMGETYKKAFEAMPRELEPKGRAVAEGFRPARRGEDGVRRQWWRRRSASRAMAESVEEVWEEGAWEERWEVGRVGVWVEADIMWDLVEELIVELFGWRCKVSLQWRRCRKRLRF